ncbi:ribonuclease H-like domain-containing protein [Rhizoctonia solani]|nr:ribonuclease H-like domain-containing protein [Rhizoctonia solani]
MTTEFSPETVSSHLDELRDLLSNLPENIPQSEGACYPFLGYKPDPKWVETTGSRQGAPNRVLEHTFGSRHERISTGQSPVKFLYQGPDLLALVDVLQSYLTGGSPEDGLLHEVDEATCKKQKTDCIEVSNLTEIAKRRTQRIGCQFLPSELREEARKALRELAPSVQLANLENSEAHGQEKGQNQATKRKLTGDDLPVRLICSEFLRPTLVNSQAFRAYVNHLDPATKVINSTTCVKLIRAKAEAVVQNSIDTLQQHHHLSLSFDGATLRGSQSVYTVHVTPPDTRQPHLIEGNEASGESHTALHIKGVLLKAINAIDSTAKLFSAISSDSTGNTRLARELLANLYPWLIIIPDPCHHLNNCAKDIGSLSYFGDAIAKLRVVIRHFSKSTYAGHHLAALRVFWGITRGLVNWGHKLAWMKDTIQLREFKDHLQQLHAILRPLARSVVCLESSASTPGDIYYLWISIQSALCRIFTQSSQLGGLHLPESLISDIYMILNSRFAEVLDGSGNDGNVYLATSMPDFRYLQSAILTRKHTNPLSNVVHIPAQGSTSASGLSDLRESFVTFGAAYNADLRQSMPAYLLVGQYLVMQLQQEVNSKRAPHIQHTCRTWDALVQVFRIQFIKYIRQLPPFNEHNEGDSPIEYWMRLSAQDDASILAYLAVKLFSIVANSMADERTGSVFTKINSPDRSNQSADLVVAMAQILQYERRKSNQRSSIMTRFRDIPGLIKSTDLPASQQDIDSDAGSTENSDCDEAGDILGPDDNELELTDHSNEPEEWEISAGLDEEPEPLWRGKIGHREYFEVARHDGIDLRNPSLLDLLSDGPIEEEFMSSGLATDQTGPTLPYADIRATPTSF